MTLWWIGDFVLLLVVVPVVLGLALALLLTSAPARLRAVMRAVLLLSLLLPTTVIAVVWRLLYNPLAGPITGALNAVGLGTLAGDWLGDPGLALDALLVPACWAAFGLSMLVFEAALGAIASEVVDAAQIDGAGTVHFAHHVRRRCGRFDDDDRDGGVRHVLLQRLRDVVAQLDRRETGGVHVADQRQRHFPVRTHLNRLRQLRILVNLDAQFVAGAEVIFLADQRRNGARFLVRIFRGGERTTRQPGHKHDTDPRNDAAMPHDVCPQF